MHFHRILGRIYVCINYSLSLVGHLSSRVFFRQFAGGHLVGYLVESIFRQLCTLVGKCRTTHSLLLWMGTIYGLPRTTTNLCKDACSKRNIAVCDAMYHNSMYNNLIQYGVHNWSPNSAQFDFECLCLASFGWAPLLTSCSSYSEIFVRSTYMYAYIVFDKCWFVCLQNEPFEVHIV